MSSLSEKIRLARIEKGLTQKEFGAILGETSRRKRSYSQASVASWESGKQVPAHLLPIIAQVLGKRLEDFQLSQEEVSRLQVRRQRLSVPVEQGALLTFSYQLANHRQPLPEVPGTLYGTSDGVGVEIHGRARVVLHFASCTREDNPIRSVALTKLPAGLLTALMAAFTATGDMITEYKAENFGGRILYFNDIDALTWVAEFAEPIPIGFAIHLERSQMRELIGEMTNLSHSSYVTD